MAAELQLQVGWLVPLRENGEEDHSVSSIPIYEGVNTVENVHVARERFVVHAQGDSVEISVTGSSPITLKSGSGAKMLLNPLSRAPLLLEDIVELLPGKFPFKYVTCRSHKGKAVSSSAETSASHKRKRQIDEDEAFARALQDMQNQSYATAVHVSSKPRLHGEHGSQGLILQRRSNLPCGFQLMKVQGLPDWANEGCVKISDVIKGEVLVAILSNYMIDIEWILSACPLLLSIPQVVVIHGESNVKQLQAMKPSNWLLYKPPLRISYGTHHSKAMLLIYPTGVRVVIHTANYISVDWNNKSQGLWMQDFPFKSMTGNIGSSDFENDLIDYLTALEWSGCTVDLKHHGQMKINAAYFRNFDYSNATVRLVASVPGYHSGRHLTKWGHMKFRSILRDEVFDMKFQKAPLVCQFSSLGSLDEKWMEEFASSMCEGPTRDKESLGLGQVQIIFPTVEDVRMSLEGYRAGNAIPSNAKNVDKSFLKKYWYRWIAEYTGRSRAMPHIKTYVRYHQDNSLAWFCLTSANLSKAAWGALQKNKTQLMIRSYELGVIFLPSMLEKYTSSSHFSCTDDTETSKTTDQSSELNVELCTLAANTDNLHNTRVIRLPLPYALPPLKYSAQDEPWSWDKTYLKPDVYGNQWKHG